MRRKREVRYGEEERGEPERVEDGGRVYGPHKVGGRCRTYVRTVEEVIVQQHRTGDETRAAIVQWMDKKDEDNEWLPHPEAGLRVGPRAQEMYIQGRFVPEHEVKELEGMGLTSGRKARKRKGQPTKRRAAAGASRPTGQRKDGKADKKKRQQRRHDGVRRDGEARWQHMTLYTHNGPAALYQGDKAAWQQMRLHEADADVAVY